MRLKKEMNYFNFLILSICFLGPLLNAHEDEDKSEKTFTTLKLTKETFLATINSPEIGTFVMFQTGKKISSKKSII